MTHEKIILGPSPCQLGYTYVCENNSPVAGNTSFSPRGDVFSSDQKMAEICPANLVKRSGQNNACTCLPTRGVEQDMAAGLSPLGRKHQGCVRVNMDLVFPDLKGNQLYVRL